MKTIYKKIIALMLVAILISFNFSFAVTQSEINAQKNKQTQLNNQINDAEEKKKEVEQEKSETLKEVESLNSQIDGYESQIDELDSQIATANAQIKESEEKIKQNEAEQAKQEELLKQRLVYVYESGETSYLDFLLSSDNLMDFISNYFLVSEVTQMDKGLLDNLAKQKQEIEDSKKQIEESKQTLTTAKASKESVSSQLKTAKSEKDSKVANLSDQEKELQKQIEELKAANAQIANEIRAAEIKYQKQLEELKKRASSTTPSGSGYFSAPVSASVTASAYYSSGSFHGALDYGVSVGTPVKAAADGVVMSTANLTTSYGTYVVIRHANGLQTYYCHGTKGSICVTPGQLVSRGQQIMLSGSTGHSKGPHLHFEVRKSPYSYSYSATAYGQDCRVNPYSYL